MSVELPARLTAEQARLVEDNLPLVGWVVNKWPVPDELSYAEAHAAGQYGLVAAARTYDPSKAKFSTHAVTRIRGAIMDDARHMRGGRSGKWVPARVVSLDSVLNRVDDDGGSDRDRTPSRAQYTEDTLGSMILSEGLRRGLSLLNERERLIVTRLAEGHTQARLAAELCVSEARVSQLLKRLREKLGKEMNA